MGAETAIEWADHTFNPWIGCTKVSPGCTNCYAETLMDKRYGRVRWGKGQPRSRTASSNWRQPLAWNRAAEKAGATARVFCASLADWLDPEVPAEWLADLLVLVAATPHLTWMLLTKRPERWASRIGAALDMASVDELDGGTCEDGIQREADPWVRMAVAWRGGAPPSNVWVGTTVEDQERADQRIPALLEIPARVRFLSCEPLLERVDLADVAGASTDEPGGPRFVLPGIHWVICGGESGPGARPMHPDWARSLRDQCQAAGVPFHFKQWGAWCPGDQVDELVLRSKKQAGRLLDGRTWDELPA